MKATSPEAEPANGGVVEVVKRRSYGRDRLYVRSNPHREILTKLLGRTTLDPEHLELLPRLGLRVTVTDESKRSQADEVAALHDQLAKLNDEMAQLTGSLQSGTPSERARAGKRLAEVSGEIARLSEAMARAVVKPKK